MIPRENFTKVRLPNEGGFHDGGHKLTERRFWDAKPCMTDCKTEVKARTRARSRRYARGRQGRADSRLTP